MKIIMNFKPFIFCLVILIFLISSCSEQRYTYYNIDKKKASKVVLEKPVAINLPTEMASEDVLDHKEKTTEEEQVAEVSKKKEVAASNKNPKKGAVTKKVIKAIDKTVTAPIEALTEVPKKLNTIFPKHKDTASLNNDDHSNLLWTIIAIVLILWLLGFLVGDLGNIIHLLLVVALILIILNLLGV